MKVLAQIFNWMLVIGLLLMGGRIITFVLYLMDIPFTSFFQDYSFPSVIILIVGLIGSQVMKDKKG